MNKDKVTGLFLGTYLGDALGMPVENWSKEKIQKTYDRITTLLVPEKRSWFNGEKAGTPTDDWQLTKSVAEALIYSDPLNMKFQVKFHIKALEESTSGWGKSTKESVIKLKMGTHWKKSGNPTGAGSGIVMKIAPLGAFAATKIESLKKCKCFATKLAKMTHKTVLAMSSGLVQMMAIHHCIKSKELDINKFAKLVLKTAIESERKCIKPRKDKCKDKLSDRLIELPRHVNFPEQRIIDEFGGGSCYVYNSLPFAYMFFVQNPHSIDALFNVINAGGDTDTNGSIVGALLGSLNGMAVFPEDLLERIPDNYYQEIVNISEKFSERFGFK